MKRHAAELLTRDPERFFHHDRVFLNNPVVMQGMGLAPLVVLATTGLNAGMLAVAGAALQPPSEDRIPNPDCFCQVSAHWQRDRSVRKSSTADSGVAQLVTRRMQVWSSSTGWSISNS